MTHITLLGDSIFDNQAYVGENGIDVITHLNLISPKEWQTTLKAIDGNIVEDVSKQLLDSPKATTHFFISVGGNNALMNADILGLKINSSAELFNVLADRINHFEYNYAEMLKTVAQKNLPTTVCTIYYPNIPDGATQKISVAALSSFNDIIIKQAIIAGIPIIDLRLVCSEKDDYANEIEPSNKGGEKIAKKILK